MKRQPPDFFAVERGLVLGGRYLATEGLTQSLDRLSLARTRRSVRIPPEAHMHTLV